MPRAGHDATVELTLGKRAALMLADVVDGVEFSGDVEHRHLAAADIEHTALSRRNLALARHSHEVRHAARLLRSVPLRKHGRGSRTSHCLAGARRCARLNLVDP